MIYEYITGLQRPYREIFGISDHLWLQQCDFVFCFFSMDEYYDGEMQKAIQIFLTPAENNNSDRNTTVKHRVEKKTGCAFFWNDILSPHPLLKNLHERWLGHHHKNLWRSLHTNNNNTSKQLDQHACMLMICDNYSLQSQIKLCTKFRQHV